MGRLVLAHRQDLAHQLSRFHPLLPGGQKGQQVQLHQRLRRGQWHQELQQDRLHQELLQDRLDQLRQLNQLGLEHRQGQ